MTHLLLTNCISKSLYVSPFLLTTHCWDDIYIVICFQFSAPVRRKGIRMSKSFQVRRNTVVEEGEVLIIRKLVVAGIIAAEKSYIECLNALKEVSYLHHKNSCIAIG